MKVKSMTEKVKLAVNEILESPEVKLTAREKRVFHSILNPII